MKLLVFRKYKPIHLQLFETLSLNLYPVIFLFFRERASSYLFRFCLSFISILELQSPMEEFRLSALPEELQDLVVQGVAKTLFRDLFRLRTTSKHMKEITVSPGVYASLNVFDWPSHIPRPLRLYEEFFAHESPSTLYLKGSQYFFLYGFEEEGLALIKTAADKCFEIAMYTYAMVRKAFWDDEEFFSRFNRDDIRTISMGVKENGWGWGWPPNATALLTKSDEFMASVLPSYFTCECTTYN